MLQINELFWGFVTTFTKNIHGHGPKKLLYFAYKIKDRQL